ncbi:MAG: radical SAM protein [Desulfobacterales bacterium]|nr:radical SAM protein [Desulfobacterales bacterium]
MKILLINPPNSGKSIPEEKYGIQSIKMIFRGEPLALEILAGNLPDHEVEIVDLKVEPDALKKYLESFNPDLIGITGVTCEANSILDIGREIKEWSHGEEIKPLVVGGHHATCDPEYFNREHIDYVAIGLGKSSFRELIIAIENNKETDTIPGIAKTDQSKPLSFIPRTYSKKDLVEDRQPRYDLVEKYRDQYIMSGVGGKIGFVVTAFGCTHRCIFCSIPGMTGGKYLSHDTDSILRDITAFEDISLIRFVDANTFGNVIQASEFADRLIESGLAINIVADVRADTIVKHSTLIGKWKQAGLTTVVIGFEDISDERLIQLNKNSLAATNIKALEILKDLHIKVIGDFIISPDYGLEDFEKLEVFIASHPIDLPIPSILTPLPGTPLYDKLKSKIEIHDLDYYTFSNAVIPTRLETKVFYETYSRLLKHLHQHISN